MQNMSFLKLTVALLLFSRSIYAVDLAPQSKKSKAGYAAHTFFKTEFDVPKVFRPYHSQVIHIPVTKNRSRALDPQAKHLETEITHVSFEFQDKATPYIANLYLHKCANDGTKCTAPKKSWHLLVNDFDFRKFLYQFIHLQGIDNRSPDLDSYQSKKHQCIRKVHAHLAEFARVAKSFHRLRGSTLPKKQKNKYSFGDIHQFEISNNCREPGNFEFGLKNADGKKFFRGHFTVAREDYDRILKSFTYGQMGIAEQGTGTRYYYDFGEGGFYKSSLLERKKMPECHIEHLAPYIGYKRTLIKEGMIKQPPYKSKIDYMEFAKETQRKSGFNGSEPLAYVKVTGKLPPPVDFKSHGFIFKNGKRIDLPASYSTATPKQFWDHWIKKTRSTIYAPHVFRTWGNLTWYEKAYTSFEVDGSYLGKEAKAAVPLGASSMYAWDSPFLKYLKFYKVYHVKETNRIEVRLLNIKEGTNLIIGNIDMQALKKGPINFIMGIGTQPLSSPYNLNTRQQIQKYALAYDKRGEVVDHHPLGVEQIYIRKYRNGIIIDIVSYERVTPLKRAYIEVDMMKLGH